MELFKKKNIITDSLTGARKKEERYKKIFELSPEAIVILDRKGKLLDLNKRLYDWLGYKPEDVEGKNMLALPFFSKEGKALMVSNLAKRIMGKEVAPYELDFFKKSGEVKIGLIRAVGIKNEKGRIVEDLVMISDVTDEKKAERELKRSEERYSIVTRETGQLIYDYDLKTGKIEWSGAIEGVSGFKPKEFKLGIKEWGERIHPEDRGKTLTLLDEAKKSANRFVAEYRFKVKDESYKNIIDSGVFLDDKDCKACRMLGVMRDITDRKNAESNLRSRTEESEKLNELTVGRELKMAQLKDRIKELENIEGKEGSQKDVKK